MLASGIHLWNKVQWQIATRGSRNYRQFKLINLFFLYLYMIIVFIGYAVIFCVISTIQLHFSKSYMTLSGVNNDTKLVLNLTPQRGQNCTDA